MAEDKPDREKTAAPGKNCWRIEHAGRASFLVDGDAYFRNFAETAKKAKHSILIIGWDIDSRIQLVRDNAGDSEETRLGDFLESLVSETDTLNIHILIWDYSIVYASEREPLLTYKLDKRSHPRIHFRFDSRHPVGASHHQKFAVIDDEVAFSGGLDLTSHRWDTEEHRPEDPRRKDPKDIHFGPYHDVQMMVDEDAAKALGDLGRERWERATGETVGPPINMEDHDPWPSSLVPDMENVQVAISRTDRESPDGDVREVERLFLDSIAAAKDYIYIENQFLTSASISEALGKRLEEEDGPEVVIVTPRQGPGWLEDSTMIVLRNKVVVDLVNADRHDRLRIYYPETADKDAPGVFIHAKVFISDDSLLRIGSANISNRSMGLDTECDLTIESGGDPEKEKAISAFRDRLIAHYMGIDREIVAAKIQGEGSLIRGIEKLDAGNRGLMPLEVDLPEWAAELVPEISIVDPEDPIIPRLSLERIMSEEEQGPGMVKRVFTIAGIIIALAGLAAAWRYTPLKEYADPAKVAALAAPVVDSAAAPAIVIGAYVLGGLIMFPVTVMVLATAILFDPLEAFGYSMGGCLASATAIYFLGAAIGKERVRKLLGQRLNRVSERIAKRGIIATALIRNFPVAPFSVVNLAAGVSPIKFWHYIAGTAIGMFPGVLAITMFGESVARAVQDPDPVNIGIVLGVIAAIAVGWYVMKRYSPRLGS